MDQSLKQRLVGVLVITALVAIFLPMLFDNPVEEGDQTISELGIPPSPVTAYEKDVPQAQTSAEEVLELPEPDYVLAESDLEEVAVEPEQPVVDQEPLAKQTPAVPEQAPAPSPPTPAQPVKQERSAALKRWVIQVGSFSAQKNAETLKHALIKQGFTAFVDTFKSKQNKVWYRVQVGPELDKNRARQMQKKIEKQNKIKTVLRSE